MANCNKKRPTPTLRDRNNDIILGIENKLQRWKEYVEELFDDGRPNTPPEADESVNERGPEITKDEVIHAIKAQKDGKATGPDNIHAEVIKLIAEQEGKGLQLLTSIFNSIYRTGTIPTDWLRSRYYLAKESPRFELRRIPYDKPDAPCPQNIPQNNPHQNL